jgi:hypothetical protein
LDEVQLTAAIINASKTIDNFFMNGFNKQYLVNSGITTSAFQAKPYPWLQSHHKYTSSTGAGLSVA